jgi:hypothetical protein
MAEYAPAAIQGLFEQIQAAIPEALMGGIQGDAAHTYGYHRGRDYVPSSDYSVQLAEDKQGDGEACCGLDLSWTAADPQYTVSRRLLDASDDSRMFACREFYGSTDGVHVCGWDYAGGYPVSSDDSHLWHVHLSILRRYADDPDALDGIAQVITGSDEPSHETDEIQDEEDDMKAFLARDGSDQYWVVAGDFSSRTLITKQVNDNLAKTGRYDTNPGLDQTTLVHIPDVTNR